MNIVRLAVAAFVLTLSFSSCKRCVECVKYPGKSQELCQSDYGSKSMYDMAYRQKVAEGYRCD